MTETEYDLHTKGARHSFSSLDLERTEPGIGDHDAICVQLCRKAGMSDSEIDTLLNRATAGLKKECAQLRIENRSLIRTIEHQQRWMDAVGAGGVSGQRIMGGGNG